MIGTETGKGPASFRDATVCAKVEKRGGETGWIYDCHRDKSEKRWSRTTPVLRTQNQIQRCWCPRGDNRLWFRTRHQGSSERRWITVSSDRRPFRNSRVGSRKCRHTNAGCDVGLAHVLGLVLILPGFDCLGSLAIVFHHTGLQESEAHTHASAKTRDRRCGDARRSSSASLSRRSRRSA